MPPISPHILFEDRDLLVIEKQAGWVVNRSESYEGETIQDWMSGYLAEQEEMTEAEWRELLPEDFDESYGSPQEVFADRVGMLHRLDKDTSGILVLAKNPGSLQAMLALFRKRELVKRYECLIHGKLAFEQDTLEFPIARSSFERKMFAVRPDGRTATTGYQVQNFYPQLAIQKIQDYLKTRPDLQDSEAAKQFKKRSQIYQGFSLVSCWPKTGRTHQIRVHFSFIKHPLVGDQLYVGKKRQKLDALWCPRHFLHASSLQFIHPRTKEELVFESALPADLLEVISFLEPV